MMAYHRDISQKDKEDALLFKEFIYLLHSTENTTKQDSDFEGDSVELNMGSSCYSNEHKNESQEGNSALNEAYSSSSQKYTNVNSEYSKFQNFNFETTDRKDLTSYQNRSDSYFDGDLKKQKNEPFQFTETDQGFICAYCESKYIYKRCLINHLLKSHRKLIKNTKYRTPFDL